jgi:hypothetical protein
LDHPTTRFAAKGMGNIRIFYEDTVAGARATFTFPEHDLPKLREIANDWAEERCINAKHLLMLEKASMRVVRNIWSRWAPSKREAKSETIRRVFEE